MPGTLADILSQATMNQMASKRGRDWLSSIPQAVQPAGPPDSTVPGSAANDYNTSYGNLLGSQVLSPDSGLSAFYNGGGSGYPPSAEQQRQEMAQMQMQRELARLEREQRLRASNPPSSLPTPGWMK